MLPPPQGELGEEVFALRQLDALKGVLRQEELGQAVKPVGKGAEGPRAQHVFFVLGIALAHRQQIFAALVHVAVHQVQQEGDYPFFQQSGLPPPQKPLPVGDGLLQHRRVPIPQPNKQMGGIIALLLS